MTNIFHVISFIAFQSPFKFNFLKGNFYNPLIFITDFLRAHLESIIMF